MAYAGQRHCLTGKESGPACSSRFIPWSIRCARERDFERFLTFVDAVVAIAMTLLVLPLADIANQLGNGSVDMLLEDHQAQIYGFVLSFFVIRRSGSPSTGFCTTWLPTTRWSTVSC